MVSFIDEKRIFETLKKTKDPSPKTIERILKKAERKKGLSFSDVGYLVNCNKSDLPKIFKLAKKIKRDIYGERLVLFAPLYVSDFCANDCEYCGFHKRHIYPRKKLTLAEVAGETEELIKMGHKRLLLEFGEHPKENPIDYVVDVIRTIYNTKVKNGEIRRVNVNIAGTTTEDYAKLKAAGIGTYQLFQETYHRDTYEKMHHGPKADYERQIFAHIRAYKGGIDDLGIGVLFGLYDWRFEVLALICHAQFMEKTIGVGPHTISVPRLQAAPTVDLDSGHQVGENELLKIIAILRLAVPYTGMIISTRERPEIRKKAFEIGISQTSAGSRVTVGGYKDAQRLALNAKSKGCGQFDLHDGRSLDEIVASICEEGLLPSFCTACYRKGRTGEAFMEIAKPGEIHNLCRPNAILTFKEYLLDYASPKTKKLGEEIIKKYLDKIESKERRQATIRRLGKLEEGKRDLYF